MCKEIGEMLCFAVTLFVLQYQLFACLFLLGEGSMDLAADLACRSVDLE